MVQSLAIWLVVPLPKANMGFLLRLLLQDTLERMRQRFSLSYDKGVLSAKVSKLCHYALRFWSRC